MKELVCMLIIGIVLFSGCAGKPTETTTTILSSSTTAASTTSTTRSVTSTTHAASSTTQAGSSTTTMEAATTTQPAAVTVRISGFAFNPNTLTVSKGTTVTWVNGDPSTHTIVSDSGSFTSGGLGNGDTFSHTFTESGTFGYHCGIHPSMKGTVVVQ